MQSQYAKLIVQEGPTAGEEYPLAGEETIIGRDPSVNVIISTSAVSRRHARISFDGRRYLIEDLASSNGTFLNGEPLAERQPLRHGDTIGLGKSITLTFHMPLAETRVSSGVEDQLDATRLEVSDATRLEVGSEPAEMDGGHEAPTLTVSVGGFSSHTHTLTEPEITFGRADSNDIVVRSPIVSRQHARLVRQRDGDYALEVLPEASNPIIVDGVPVTGRQPLRDGEAYTIGRPDAESTVSLIYRAAARQEETPAAEGAAATQHIDWEPAREKAPAAPPSPPSDPGRTMLQRDFEQVIPPSGGPPSFEVTVAGDTPQRHTLTKNRVTIGRAEDNDIIVPSRIFSRYHAYLQRDPDGGYQFVPLPDASNPVQYQGRPLSSARKLKHRDLLRVGGADPGSMVTMTYVSPSEAPAFEERTLDFAGRDVIAIGRDAENDLVLDNPTVSRYHAQIEKVGQRFRVRDLRSSNGTFVNGQRVEGEVWLKQGDSVRVGNVSFEMGEEKLAQVDAARGLRVEAIGLNKWVRKDLNILQEISLVFEPREFIVVVGQSGGGKTTLVDAIAGYRPATHGRVEVNDIDVYRNFDAIRNEIGYVPQKDIIHMELTVFQALDYAAQLRMPPDTSKAERHRRIAEVLEDLDIAHRKDTQISQLSGGQQKRVSIGVELLTKPGLFFLDEPTSGLDPGTETALMQLMRRLADQGRTIVLITHATKNVMLADKVVFLARGGYLAWFGPPDEALAYFDQYRSDRDRRTREMEFDEIYAVLEDSSKGSPQEWAERYHQHPAYQQYVARPLEHKAPAVPSTNGKGAPTPPKRKRQVSSLRQLKILSARNLRILMRDRFALLLMLFAAPLVSLLDVVLSVALGRNVFDTRDGSIQNVMITLFLLTVYGVMVGGLAQMREIVKERDIYRRERLVNLRLFPYILSKIWVAALLALYQSFVYVFVHYLVFDMPGGWLEFVLIYITLTLATMSGMMLGLFASALAPNANSAPLIVTLLVLPQIVLAGALVPLPEFVTGITSTRWAFQNFMAITGAGSDVAADACWDFTEEEQAALKENPEAIATCRCLGTNILTQCDFPGVARSFNEQALEPPPVAPDSEIPPTPGPPPVPPPTPIFPPTPVPPEDEGDVVAAQEFREEFQAYQDLVLPTQEAFEADLAEFQSELDIFQEAVDEYPQQLAAVREEQEAFAAAAEAWARQNAAAVLPAEGTILAIHEGFSWTFTNKEDPAEYWGVIGTSWAMLILINFLLFGAILVLQKRKDVA